MRKNNDGTISINIAHRERDCITIDEDGLSTLRLLLSIGRREHNKFLKTHMLSKKESLNWWGESLKFRDKVIEQIFMSTKRIIVEVDWNIWDKIEKELNAETRKLNK